MTDTERLEQEGNETRDRISVLLDEMRGRLSPGELVDQVMGLARDGAPGDFARNFGNQVRNNPVPCLMIGVGIAWLIWSDSRPRPHRMHDGRGMTGGRGTDRGVRGISKGVRNMTEDTKSTASDTAGRVSANVSDAARRASEAADRARAAGSEIGSHAAAAASGVADAASQVYARTRETGERALEQASSAVSTVRRAAGAARNTGSSVARFVEDHPLVLFGVGLALGAALGAMFPTTRTENRILGDMSDDLKHQARDFASSSLQKAEAIGSHAAQSAAQAAEEEAQRQGLSFGGEHGTARPDAPAVPKTPYGNP